MSFKKINEACFFLPGAINIGLIVQGNKGIVIDTGMDKDSARKIAKGLEELQVNPVAIINTHSHADHCGGNIQLQKRYPEIKIYASAEEKALIEQPYYEGFYLFGGAQPPKEMQSKFLKAEASNIDKVLNPGKNDIAGISIEIVPLPGHSVGQIGIVYEDVFYVADSYFGKDIVAKYGVPYYTNIAATLASFDTVGNMQGTIVPCHGQVTEEASTDIEENRKAIEQTIEALQAALKKPMTENQLVRILAQTFNLNLKALGQYYLSKATVMAYLSYFLEEQKVTYNIENGSLYWKAL